MILFCCPERFEHFDYRLEVQRPCIFRATVVTYDDIRIFSLTSQQNVL